jgi:hypothetical protein
MRQGRPTIRLIRREPTRADARATAKRRPTERSAAFYGLVGTLIGAVIGLTGTYLTLQQADRHDALATKREAYAALVAEAEAYRRDLLTLEAAIAALDQEKYEQGVAALREASVELYAAHARVWLVADDSTRAASNDLTRAFFPTVTEPENVRDYEAVQVRALITAGGESIDRFLVTAGQDLQDE